MPATMEGNRTPCLACGGGTSIVTDSRPSGGFIRRRRKCTACGHHWTTMEVPMELISALPVMSRGLRHVHEAMGRVLDQLDQIPLNEDDEDTDG
jgi:transcriptional regulator NrdR family protein